MNYRPRFAERTFTVVLAMTALFEGVRAGAGTFRLLLDLPARFSVGPVAFAEFSRATDLSMRGIVFYSIYGVGGALLTAAAWLIAWRTGAPRLVRALTGVACLCSATVLVLTTQAAPLMWKLGSSPNDPAALADLLDRFTFWTTLRVACVDFSFLAIVAALALLAVQRRTPATAIQGTAVNSTSELTGKR
jgi:hypothetical protein